MELKCTTCETDVSSYLSGWLWRVYGEGESQVSVARFDCPVCGTYLEIRFEWQPAQLKSATIEYSRPPVKEIVATDEKDP